MEVLSFADYYPHGSTMPGRSYVPSTSYPYSYQGQEKDNETGFLNFELRQYDARIGRWFNPDPMGQYHSPYLAMGNNPVSRIDPTGGADGYISDDGFTNHSAYITEWNNEFGSSEFDREHFSFMGGSGGSHNADGTFTSNETWVAEAHDSWKNNS